MSMKKILMAAAAVSALTAGSANAISIANTTSMGTSSITLATSGTASGTSDPYTLANEITTPASTVVVSTVRSTLSQTLTNGTAYIVTYTLTNGTFENPSSGAIVATDLTALDNQATPASVTLGSQSLGTVNTTKAEFVFTPGAANAKTLIWATKGIKPLSTKQPVTMTVSIAQFSSPTVAIDGGVSAAATLIDFRDSVSFKASAKDQKLSIASGFKKFVPASGTTDATYGDLATAMGISIAAASSVGGTNDIVYKNGSGTAVASSDVTAAVLTIGGDLSKLDGRLGSAQLADTGTTNTFTADSTNLSAFQGGTATFGLVNKATALVGAEGSYTVTPVLTMSTGLTGPTISTTKIGSVSFEGTSLYLPWVSDGSNGTNNVIRIGNKSATTAISSVKASLLNPTVAGTSGTVASTATCELGTIAAAGELTINSAALTTCFGAFKRSDVRLTVQGAEANLTLKMRSSTAGITTENIVGSGVTASTGNN
jgi:hypothetical protein